MHKPALLRDHLTAATPYLAEDPSRLDIYVGTGRLLAAGGNSLSFEYAYTLQLVVLDFRGHADAIMVPLLAWLKRHQVDLFENEDRRRNGIRFEAELLNQETVDLTIEVDLTEAVKVRPGEAPADPSTAMRYTIVHQGEPLTQPAPAGMVQIEVDGTVIASWSITN